MTLSEKVLPRMTPPRTLVSPMISANLSSDESSLARILFIGALIDKIEEAREESVRQVWLETTGPRTQLLRKLKMASLCRI